jgi:hypothetical protein
LIFGIYGFLEEQQFLDDNDDVSWVLEQRTSWLQLLAGTSWVLFHQYIFVQFVLFVPLFQAILSKFGEISIKNRFF